MLLRAILKKKKESRDYNIVHPQCVTNISQPNFLL